MPFYFVNNYTSFYLKQKKERQKNLSKVLSSESLIQSFNIQVVLLNDKDLLHINRRFLHHNTLTDVITFPIEQAKQYLEAEIYISIDRVIENAKKYRVSFYNEFDRVCIHGVLHLCEINDRTKKEKQQMRAKETKYLKKRPYVSRET